MGQITGWNRGPALEAAEDGCLFEVGDQLLVLVEAIPLVSPDSYWDPHVITCTENGWDDANGESWSAWDWSDVSWWIKLDQRNLPPLGEGT